MFRLLLILPFLFFSACDSKNDTVNTHLDAPKLEEPNTLVNERSLSTIAQIRSANISARSLWENNRLEQKLSAIDLLAEHALRRSNLNNPDLHDDRTLHSEYRDLIETYAKYLVTLLRANPSSVAVSERLMQFKHHVFDTCSLINRQCRSIRAFKNPYTVSIMAEVISRDMKLLQEGILRPEQLATKRQQLIFSLFVLESLDEAFSQVTSSLYLQFAQVYFNYADIAKIDDSLELAYLSDLKNIFVRQSGRPTTAESCGIFKTIDPLSLKDVVSDLDSGFKSQITSYFYRCNTTEEIVARIFEIESAKSAQFTQRISENGPWSEFSRSYHTRRVVLEQKVPQVLRRYNISQPLSGDLSYFLDQIYFGGILGNEWETLSGTFDDEMLMKLIQSMEQYAQEATLYAMHYTFAVFMESVKKNYELQGQTISEDFASDTFVDLNDRGAFIWKDYKDNVDRLRQLSTDLQSRLSADRRSEVDDIIDHYSRRIFDSANVINMVNTTVTFPILIAMTHYLGKNASGTMKLSFPYLSGTQSELTISVANAFLRYFNPSRADFNRLQVLDFGSKTFDPKELQRNIGLSMAVKNGFFEVVELDLGNQDKTNYADYADNVVNFFTTFVDDNDADLGTSDAYINSMETFQNSDWNKTQRLCRSPRLLPRLISITQMQTEPVMGVKDLNEKFGDTFLDRVSTMYDYRTKIFNLREEMNEIKRVYLILRDSLAKNALLTIDLEKQLIALMAPHLQASNSMQALLDSMIEGLTVRGHDCLYQLEKMQRFQQNLMQRKHVRYLIDIHAFMTILREFDPVDLRSMGAKELQPILDGLRGTDIGVESFVLEALLSKIQDSEVLSWLEENTSIRGYALLSEAFNLMVSPHNIENVKFGFFVKDISETTENLQGNFLKRRGEMDRNQVVLSRRDQEFIMRSMMLGLEVTKADIKKYFGDGYEFFQVNSLEDDDIVALNPGLTIDIDTFQKYDDALKTTENRHAIEYSESVEGFVLNAMEGMHSTKTSSMFFSWRVNNDGNIFDDKRVAEREIYIHDDHYVADDESDLTCIFNTGFDTTDEKPGCTRKTRPASQLITDFIKYTEFFYYDEESGLYPLVRQVDDESGSAEASEDLSNIEESYLDEIVRASLLASDHFDYYDKGRVLKFFQYYGFLEDITKWTFFDDYIATDFTVNSVPDTRVQFVYVPITPGDSLMRGYFTELTDSRYEEYMLPASDSAEVILRDGYRTTITSFMHKIHEIETEILKIERDEELVLPMVGLKIKDIANSKSEGDKDDFVFLDYPRRDNGGFHLLGESEDYEMFSFRENKENVFGAYETIRDVLDVEDGRSRYECFMLPKTGDSDYSAEIGEFMQESDESCQKKAEAVVRLQYCNLESARVELIPGFTSRCEE